jgi:glycosyltransferase involved in cell wall biosynthesis
MSDTRLRVAINASFWGQETTGSGQYLHHLTAALVALDGAPEVVLCGAGAPQAAPALPSGATWRTVPASPWRRLGENVEKVWFEQVAFPRAARAVGATVAHVPYFASPRFPQQPTVVTVHDLIPLLLPGYRSSALVRSYMRLVAAAARRASLVLTDAEASVGDIVRHLGVPQERVRAIPLAVPPAYRPQGSEALAALRARYELPERYLLYLGGYDRRRNLATLFQALAEAQRREPALPALVMAGALPAGDSAFTPDPRRLAMEAGLAERVRFLGRVPEEDKPALYSGATAFVFPSRYEGFGLTVLEALACGAPAVIADATTLPEVAGPGALRAGPDDVAAWAEAIVRLATDEALRARLRAKGLAQAARFSWQRTARETLAAYREAAQHRPAYRAAQAADERR